MAPENSETRSERAWALGHTHDALRDQTHTAAGYARLRFSHHQVRYEREHVRRILTETAARLTG
jgi:very-short-patch-repair endonuclease